MRARREILMSTSCRKMAAESERTYSNPVEGATACGAAPAARATKYIQDLGGFIGTNKTHWATAFCSAPGRFFIDVWTMAVPRN